MFLPKTEKFWFVTNWVLTVRIWFSPVHVYKYLVHEPYTSEWFASVDQPFEAQMILILLNYWTSGPEWPSLITCIIIIIFKIWLNNNNSIVKSIRSISQKSKFYKRAVSKFLYTKCNQCGMFYSLYWEYELKVLLISVKLAYLGNYFIEKEARQQLTWLTVLLRLQHFSCFSNFRADCYKNYWLYRKMLQTKVAQN